MPAGLLGIEELDRAEIEAILARAKDFQPHAEPELQEAGHPARQDDRQPVLRSLHAHAHQLRDRGQAAGRGRRLDHGVGLQRVQGRIAGRHAEHAGGDAAGRHRDAPRGLGRAALPGAPSADAHHQRRRRHARASHPGAARRAHHPGPLRPRSKASAWRSSATSRTAAWRARNIHLLSKFGVEIVLCGPASLLPAELGAARAGRHA